jgi:hypothetical protein
LSSIVDVDEGALVPGIENRGPSRSARSAVVLLVIVATTYVLVEMTRVNVLEGHPPVPPGLCRILVDAFPVRLDALVATVWPRCRPLLVLRYGAALVS